MLLSSKVKYFFVSRKSYPSPSLIKFRLKGTNKYRSVSKRVVQCPFSPVVPRNTDKNEKYCALASIL